MKKTIGILGGMGPLATADLFRKIVLMTKAGSDNEHIRIYIDNNSQIPDRTAAILSGGADPVPQMSDALRHLEAHPELVARLSQLAAYGRKRYQELGIPIVLSETPIIPIYTYEAMRTLQIQKEIYEAGVYVNAVLPPACAPGACLLRTSFMASLSEALIDEAAEIMGRVIHSHE